jgi:hypothetical protein
MVFLANRSPTASWQVWNVKLLEFDSGGNPDFRKYLRFLGLLLIKATGPPDCYASISPKFGKA